MSTFQQIRTFKDVKGLDEQIAHMVANQNTGVGATGVPGIQGPIGQTGLTGATGATGGNIFAGCLLYKDANESIAHNVEEALLWNLESYDTAGFHSTSADTERITIPAQYNGYYGILRVNTSWGSAATDGVKNVYIKKSGSNNYDGRGVLYIKALANINTNIGCNTAPILLATGDYFEVFVFQTNSGSSAINIFGNYSTWFSLEIIGV